MDTTDCLSFIPTRGSLKNKHQNNFEAVVFEPYVPKKSEKKTKINEKINGDKVIADFNIKQAKQEVVKMAISGLDPQNKAEAKIKLAIKLGAKPPKNQYKNYKLLQVEMKKKKEKEANNLTFQELGKNSQGKSNAKGKSFDRKRRKEKSDLLGIYGRVKVPLKK